MADRSKTVSPDRVLYPRVGFTKSQVVDFYQDVSKFILPHLKNRPVSFKRYPDTVKDESFWEKDAPPFTPKWVKTFPVPRRSGSSDINYILINDARTLLWAADHGMIEIHPFLHRIPDLDQPTHVVFDLDPGERASILDCCDVALMLREFLAGMNLQSFVKVSGSKGLQLYVPLNTPATYEMTETFARVVAERLARKEPGRIVTKMAKELRKGKVLIDWSQNAAYKTTVSVYSLRASSDWPYVSMPLKWEEVESAKKKRGSGSLQFEPDTALKRLSTVGDLFAPMVRMKQRLPEEFVTAPRPASKSRKLQAPATSRRPGKTDQETSLPTAIDLPNPKTQSSRRLFVLPRTDRGNELWLDLKGRFKRFILRPDRDHQDQLIAVPAGDFPVADSYFRGEVQDEYRDTVSIDDIGSYERMEGSIPSGRMTLFFSGRTLSGRWKLEKLSSDPKRRSWSFTPVR